MLVLSRKLQQQILIPELNITITVLSVGTNRVQLGIEAPADIQITRPEIVRPASTLQAPRCSIEVKSMELKVSQRI
jgi:carbon storage regulator CsrA